MTDSTALVVLVLLRARPGREQDVVAEVAPQLERIRAQEPACLSIAVHRHTEDPCRFMLYETWADRASFDEFVSTRPYMREYFERLDALLESRELTRWEVVG